MKKNTNYINILMMVTVLISALICSVVIGLIILFSDYNYLSKRLIVIWGFVLLVLGIIQLVTNKFRFKALRGKSWGIVFIVCSLFLIIPYKLNSVNEIMTVANNFDNEKKHEEVINIIKEEFSEEKLLDIRKRYTLSKFENTIGILNNEKIGNITYYYDDYKSKESIPIANNFILSVHNEINKYFNVPSSTPIDIAILKDFKIAEKYADSPDGFVNVFNKKLYIKSKDSLENMSEFDKELSMQYFGSIPNKDGYFEKVVLHEYTHMLTVEASRNLNVNSEDLPAWFYEGIALYIESIYNNEPLANSTTKIDGLENDFNFQGPNRNKYYERSAVIINYIIKTYGDNVIFNIISNMNDNTDIYKALENTTGNSFENISNTVFVN